MGWLIMSLKLNTEKKNDELKMEMKITLELNLAKIIQKVYNSEEKQQ